MSCANWVRYKKRKKVCNRIVKKSITWEEWRGVYNLYERIIRVKLNYNVQRFSNENYKVNIRQEKVENWRMTYASSVLDLKTNRAHPMASLHRLTWTKASKSFVLPTTSDTKRIYIVNMQSKMKRKKTRCGWEMSEYSMRNQIFGSRTFILIVGFFFRLTNFSCATTESINLMRKFHGNDEADNEQRAASHNAEPAHAFNEIRNTHHMDGWP